MSSLYVGVMSGTSLDGADAALVDFSQPRPRTLGFCAVAFPDALREQLMQLSVPGTDPLDLAGSVTLQLADLYARAVHGALDEARVKPRDVAGIGVHGQTVRHRPGLGYTVQLNDPARVAEQTGIDVVADFRRRDMAAGGQGAPLVPAFHEAVFRDDTKSRAVVNIGGIANITWLPPGSATVGFDCGPGNVLLDGWARQHLGAPFDENGNWAEEGRTDSTLLARFLSEPFLRQPPPKSTGRELFHREWLQARLPAEYRAVDVQATLTDFTAHGIIESLDRFCPGTEEIYLAGGGARNGSLASRIGALAAERPVALTDALGVPTAYVECMAFAWLAMKCLRREAVDLSAVTGAKGPRVMGAIYPA